MGWRILLLTLLLACEPDPPAKAPDAVPAAPQMETWRLIGRVTPNQATLPDAPPFEGGRAMLERCGALRPCAAERWRNEAGTTLDFLRLRDALHHPDGTVWNGRWWSISGVLRACIGDPLSVPPTRDPGAFRTLQTGPEGDRWIIRLSGENRCGLDGFVILKAHADRLDLTRLSCGGKPWKQGGRDCARDKLTESAKTVSE